MKSLKYLISTTIACLFVLSACTTPEQQATVPTSTSESNTAPVEQTAQQTAVQGEQVAIPGPAQYAQDLTCDLITNEASRANCEAQVNNTIGAILESDIITSFDMKRCKELKDKIGDNCELALSNTGVEGPVSEEEMKIFNEALQGVFPEPEAAEDAGAVDLAQPGPDISKCASLTTAGYKEYCEAQVNQQLEQQKLGEIISSGDESRCAELSETLQVQCQDFFNGGPAAIQEAESGPIPPNNP